MFQVGSVVFNACTSIRIEYRTEDAELVMTITITTRATLVAPDAPQSTSENLPVVVRDATSDSYRSKLEDTPTMIYIIYIYCIYIYMSKYHNGDHIILMVTWYRIIYTNGDHNDNFHNLLMLVSYGITFPVRACDICCSSGCWCYAISTKWFPETHLGDIIVLPQKPWPILECQAKKHE